MGFIDKQSPLRQQRTVIASDMDNHSFIRRWKKPPKLRATGLCAGNLLGNGEFPAQMASNAENVYIWWRHHERLLQPSDNPCWWT